MGSSMKKKKEKQSDFKKPKYKVGKTKAKPSNFTDTSFKSKAIVMGEQSLASAAPDAVQQFKHNLSLASSSRSDRQRKDALSYLTSQLLLGPDVNPVGTATIITKLSPLITDSSTPVRSQLLKLFLSLPGKDVIPLVDLVVMYIRAGMTHLSADISNDALNMMDWLIDVAGSELVSCPGGWVKTLNTFCASMGWVVPKSKNGWSAGSGARSTLRAKDSQSHARQILTLTRFLQTGFKAEDLATISSLQYWDNIYHMPRAASSFAYLDLTSARRDEDGEIYPDREARKQVFKRRFQDAIMQGMAQAKKEGGVAGRAAVSLDQVLQETPQDYQEFSSFETKDLLELCARVYEWNDEFGDVGPRVPDLEIELFGDPNTRLERTGLDFSKIECIEVLQEGPVKISPMKSFNNAGLHPVMVENVDLADYKTPTPIQKYTIPALAQGYDVIGIAQTGSGKTAAYLIPILSKLMGKAKKLAAPRPSPLDLTDTRVGVRAEPLVLIIVPTRELAVQIFNEARRFCYRSMLRPCVVYGGVPTREQIQLLSRGCDILVGTPGRLQDFIGRPEVLSLKRLKFVVIDEADEMLDWTEDIQNILDGGAQDVGSIQYGLFSATFPKAATELAKDYLNANHVHFRVGRAGSTTENIKQVIIKAEPSEKQNLLVKLLQEMHGIRTIIFCNSRQQVDCLDDFLFNMGVPVTSMHSDRSQTEREAALRSFRSGLAPILVATGVTARGIDVRNVMHIINYDLPSTDHGGIEEYTHRIGRTGRMGHRGVATSLYSERDEPIANVLVKTLLETKQEVPDFLQAYVPNLSAGQEFVFDSESDDDAKNAYSVGDGGNSWGVGIRETTGYPVEQSYGSNIDVDQGVSDWNAVPGNGGWGASDSSHTPMNEAWGSLNSNSSAPGAW